MTQGFSGEPLCRWSGTRNMTLEEDLYYIDSGGREWLAPKGSCLNGATIPRALWSAIGSPYVGAYRRASIVHDVAVGELCNPPFLDATRKEADRMFHDACLYDGCSRTFAYILYIGVRFGTWSASMRSFEKSATFTQEYYRENAEDKYISSKFWEVVDASFEAIENDNLDLLDEMIERELEPSGIKLD